MTEAVVLQRTQHEMPFDLGNLPAARVETHRAFGLAVVAFSLPFCAAVIAGGVWAAKSGDALFPAAAAVFFLLPLGIFAYGMNCLLTKITVQIEPDAVHQQETAFWKNRRWKEPLSRYSLQIKVLTSRTSDSDDGLNVGESAFEDPVGRLKHTYYVRLSHPNDLRSVELFSTESRDMLKRQFQIYQTQLPVKVDPRIRDYNTDESIEDLHLYGLADDHDSVELSLEQTDSAR